MHGVEIEERHGLRFEGSGDARLLVIPVNFELEDGARRAERAAQKVVVERALRLGEAEREDDVEARRLPVTGST